MMSMYSEVCRIYTPRHSVHLRHPCISVHPPSVLEDVVGGGDRVSLEICSWRPQLSEFGGRNRGSLEMHLEAEIE